MIGSLIQIDGSFGEGGGQILRSSLALSICTGTPFRIEKIRAGRKKPGLMRQHLTAVKAAATICSAQVEGAETGSTELTFTPGPVKAGNYHFAVGTAGSTTLVLQTVLPALLCADGPSTITLEGGTHNPFAPPFDFLARVYLPLVNRMGPRIEATLERPGFFPAGGGRFTVTIQPAPGNQLQPIELMTRGEVMKRSARAIVANLPLHIANRELKVIAARTGWAEESLLPQRITDTPGPGNIVMIELECENVTELFTGFGEQHLRAEAVADRAITEYRRYIKTDVPVGDYLADQLLLPLALAGGGAFRTYPLSRHSATHIELIRKFLDVNVAVERPGSDNVAVRLSS